MRLPAPQLTGRRIRLAVFDLDGTLLDDQKHLSEENVDAVRALVDSGVAVSLASGRTHPSMAEFAVRMGIDWPLVALNGSLVAGRDGHSVYEGRMQPGLCLRLLETSRDLGPKGFLFTGREILHRHEDGEPSPLLDNWTGGRFYRGVEDLEKEVGSGVLQVHWAGDQEEVASLEHAVRARSDCAISTFRYPSVERDRWHLEARQFGDDKGRGVLLLGDHLGVSPDEILAVGDWWNDVSMFDVVGVSVAMSSGIPELRKQAHFVTERSNNESGVAHFIREHLLAS